MNPYLLNQVEEMKRVDGLQSTFRNFRTYAATEKAPDSLAVRLPDLEHEIGDWICYPPFLSLLLEVGDPDPDSCMWRCQKQTLPKCILRSGKCSVEPSYQPRTNIQCPLTVRYLFSVGFHSVHSQTHQKI